jgi:MFS family permease
VAPLIGGWLAGAVSYQAMFLLAAVIGVAGWGMLHFGVHEPRKVGSAGPIATSQV